MSLQEIKEMPTVVVNTHESCYKSYHILKLVKEMILRGDSLETIGIIIDYLEQ